MFGLFDYDPAVWFIVFILLTGILLKFRSEPVTYPLQQKLKQIREQTTKLQDVFKDIGLSIQNLEALMRKPIEAFESKIALAGVALGEARHEVKDLRQRFDKVEIKAGVIPPKVENLKQQVDELIGKVTLIDAQNKENASQINGNTVQIDHLKHAVHHIEREMHQHELKQLDNKLKIGLGRVVRNTRQIDHIEQEVESLIRHDDYHHHSNGDYDGRSRAIAELESADRKIENLMDETIQIEAGHMGLPRSLNGMSGQEFEEHHRKLIDAAQHIFRDIRKYLTRSAIQDMEVAGEQIDWTRGELFANPTSAEASRAYHQHVKEYFIKLKDAITSSLHEITPLPNSQRYLGTKLHSTNI